MEIVFRSTVGDLIRRSAARQPDREALRFGARSWTYQALDAATDRVAAQLLALGLAPGDRVASFGRNSDAYLLLWLGVAKAGLIHVPVNYALTPDELSYTLGQCGARALFTDDTLLETADAACHKSPVEIRGTLASGGSGGGPDVLAWAVASSAPDVAQPVIDDDDIVQILYTSGTTSLPKGAMLSHRALVHEYVSSIVALDLSQQDRPLHALPLYHSAQMHVFLMPYLMLGATNLLFEGPEPGRVLRAIEEQGITSFFAPPTVWIMLLRHPDFAHRDLGALRRLYYGASIMPVAVLEEIRQRLPDVAPYNCFGQSEIAPLACVLRPEDHQERPDSAGRSVLFVEMRVVDDEMHDVPPGTMGEVIYRSPQLCTGYWQKPEETEESFQGGWFHSGDLARIDKDGYIFILDRKKDVINTGGVLVASREVEEALYGHPSVKEVAVVATPDPKWIEAVTAVVVLKEGATATTEELIAHARTRLAPFKVPRRVAFVADLPRNASGKILKRSLRDMLAAEDV